MTEKAEGHRRGKGGVNSIKWQARASDRDTGEQENHGNKRALLVACDDLPSTDISGISKRKGVH